VSQRFDDDPHLDLDRSLEPELRALLDRHKEAAARIDWSYHEFVPLDAHRTGTLTELPLSPSTYTAVEMALLTEVNLPWYTAGLSHGLDSCPDPIREFVHLWTSEEDQHATLLESYLLLTDNGDHGARARSRKTIVAAGWHHALSGPFEGMVYTAIQEAATRTFYLCVARACGDQHPMLAAALRRIAKDETLHMAFYRDVVKVHLDADPEYLGPLAGVMTRFEMPWAPSAMHEFEERRASLATSGVFRLADYLRDVVQPLWSYWGLDGFTPRDAHTRDAHAQLRRYRAALRKFARVESTSAAAVPALADA
jgi:acyl-[acyl-carrier-protein] desaturase